jgi:nitrogen permease regulator 2-like protein
LYRKEVMSTSGAGVLREVWEQVRQFGECCVRVSETQVLNLRLGGPVLGDGGMVGKVRAWEVPLLVREMPSKERQTWDLVFERIVPFVDGIECVKRIAALADVDVRLAKKAVGQLVKSGRVVMLDLFHFHAVYMLTADFTWFVEDAEMTDECRNFVAIDPKDNIFAGAWTKAIQHTDGTPALPERQTLINLYSSLKTGLSVADFCLAHESQIHNIDIRRLILFGVIKGFLRRVHKYALALDPPPLPPPITSSAPVISTTATTTTPEDIDRAWRKAALSSGWATPPADLPVEMLKAMEEGKSAEDRMREEDVKLGRFLDGKHCLDNVWVSSNDLLEVGEISERRYVP